MLAEIDLLLVLGSKNSSNSNRLVDVARASGVAGHLIDDETEIDERWLDGVGRSGLALPFFLDKASSTKESFVSVFHHWSRYLVKVTI